MTKDRKNWPTVAPFRRPTARPITRERLPEAPPAEGFARIVWMRELRYALAVHGYRSAGVLAQNARHNEHIAIALDDYRAWLLGEIADAVDFGLGLWLTLEGPAA